MSGHRRGSQQVFIRDPGLYGTSRIADADHLESRGFGPGGRLTFGYAPPATNGGAPVELAYSGERSVLVVAPNRTSKGASTIIPNCLRYPGGGNLIVVEARGEAAAASIRYREEVLRQRIVLYDPYNVIAQHLGRNSDRINFLDSVDPESPEFFDEAYDLSDAKVVPETHGSNFWADEARMLIGGATMSVKADPRESGKRHLGRVRQILNMPWRELKNYVAGEFEDDPATGKPRLARPGMLQSRNTYVRAAAGRILSKPERQLGDVLSTAQQNTHFLESGLIQDSLSTSDIDLAAELAKGGLTLYFVLPPRKFRTHARLSRMMLTRVISIITRLKAAAPRTLLLIDDAAALGKLDSLIDLYGVLAGSQLQSVLVYQDLTQPRELLGRQWETIVSAAGMVQAFGTNDAFTAEYLSKLSGVTSSESLTYEAAEARQGFFTDPEFFSTQDRVASRPLIRPDEFLTMHPAVMFAKPASSYPVLGYKAPYFLDARFRDRRGRPIFDMPPKYRDVQLPRPVDFTNPKIDLISALSPYLTVG